MKNLVRTVLIGGGIVGLFVAVPLAVIVWKMSGFASPDEKGRVMLICFGLPATCIVAIAIGALWKDKRTSSDASDRDHVI